MAVPGVSPETVVQGAIAVTGAGEAIVRLIAESRKRGRPLGVDDVIRLLINEARNTTEKQVTELRHLRDRLIKADVPIDTKSAAEIAADTSFWKFRKYLAIRAYRHNVHALDTLGDCYQQLLGLAHCCEAEELVAETISDASQETAKRRAKLTSNMPLGVVIQELIADAEELNNQLRNL
jgi:hypothetical protein